MGNKEISAVEPKPHFIETELDNVYEAYEKESSKGTQANHDAMCQLALRIIALLMRRANRYDTAHSEALTIKAELHMHEVKKTYNSWAPFIVTIITSVMNVGAGAIGIAGAFSAPGVAGAIGWNQKLSDLSKGISSGASGTEGLGRIFGESSNSQRTVHEYNLREAQRRRDERETTNRQSDTRMKDSMRDSKEIASAMHNAAQDVLR